MGLLQQRTGRRALEGGRPLPGFRVITTPLGLRRGFTNHTGRQRWRECQCDGAQGSTASNQLQPSFNTPSSHLPPTFLPPSTHLCWLQGRGHEDFIVRLKDFVAERRSILDGIAGAPSLAGFEVQVRATREKSHPEKEPLRKATREKRHPGKSRACAKLP